ncbi:MAG: hypothetical protein FWC28_05920 [Proteobacteria bacterium]|nr:hypothetical protein [Cystobacterineae bacterium]MCL2314769.1 hypothetical protein [Pseudomonadota bacterium]
MAGSLKLDLTFHSPIGVEDNKQDCGTRTAVLPLSLPALGDDFVWEARDFDGFRMAMLEELAARFPERKQWTPADLEVVLVEVLSWALDQLSDMLDRITAEAYLETARQPESVRRLLSLIGYEADKREWSQNPALMEAARRAGPQSVRRQCRMVNVDDYAEGMELHPLVRRAVSLTCWNGSWHCILVTVILWNWKCLNDELVEVVKDLPTFEAKLVDFHKQAGLPSITEEAGQKIRAGIRVVDSLKAWSDSRRMIGQEVLFGEAIRVGVDIGLDIAIAPQYYQSEVLQAVRVIFSAQEGGFFEIGRLSFGTHLNQSDVIQAVMQLEGIESVQVKTFRRSENSRGNSANSEAENSAEDSIVLEGFEVAVCDNNPKLSQYGALVIRCSGGLKG